jgi:hypothetical protein
MNRNQSKTIPTINQEEREREREKERARKKERRLYEFGCLFGAARMEGGGCGGDGGGRSNSTSGDPLVKRRFETAGLFVEEGTKDRMSRTIFGI